MRLTEAFHEGLTDKEGLATVAIGMAATMYGLSLAAKDSKITNSEVWHIGSLELLLAGAAATALYARRKILWNSDNRRDASFANLAGVLVTPDREFQPPKPGFLEQL